MLYLARRIRHVESWGLSMPAKSLMQIFQWPIVMGILTIIGLVLTLLLEGGWLELVSISALGIPVIIMIYIYYVRDIVCRSTN